MKFDLSVVKIKNFAWNSFAKTMTVWKQQLHTKPEELKGI